MTYTDTGDAGPESSRRPEDGEPTVSVRQMANAASQTVKEEARHFAAAAQDMATRRAEQHKETAARAIGEFSSAIRTAGQELADRDQTTASHLIRQAADGLGDLAETLANKRPEELIGSLREFGRSNPTAFAIGSALVGFAVGRVVRTAVQPEPEEERPEAAAAPAYAGLDPTMIGEDAEAITPTSGLPEA